MSYNLTYLNGTEAEQAAKKASHKYFHHDKQAVRYLIQGTFEDGFEAGVKWAETHAQDKGKS